MNGFKSKSPDLVREKKYQTYMDFSPQDQNIKHQFFRNKVRELINYRLDSSKNKKRAISEEALKNFKKPEPGSKFFPSSQQDQSSEYIQLRQNLLGKAARMEKINDLLENMHDSILSIETDDNIDTQELLFYKISDCTRSYKKIKEIINKDLSGLNIILNMLDVFYKDRSQESARLKSELKQKHQAETETLKEKFEAKIKSLYKIA